MSYDLQWNGGYDFFPQAVVCEWYDGLNDCYENDMGFTYVAMYLEAISDEENDYLT